MEILPGGLKLQLNCDEKTDFHSSDPQMPRLLAWILKPDAFPMMIVSLHCGVGKPLNVSDFLNKSMSS